MSFFNIFKRKKEHILFGVEPFINESEISKKYKNIDNRLFKKYGKCNEFKKDIKLLIFADTHGKIEYDIDYNFSIIDDYDVCLLLGDISCDDIRKILKYVDKEKVYGILGNHDYLDNLDKFNINNINGKLIEINGVKILGIEGCIKYKENMPGFNIEEGFSFIENLPACDILITHAPPFGGNGIEHNSIHIGAPYINEYIFKNKCPIVISGHNHTDCKKYYINDTLGISVYKQRIIKFNNGLYENIF